MQTIFSLKASQGTLLSNKFDNTQMTPSSRPIYKLM